MIIDGSHKSWGLVTLALLFLTTGSYVVYARYAVGGPRGGSVPGMLYGIAGSGLMLYAGLISARKKVPRWRIGTAQTWLRGHLWLGLLSVPLILFHAGFRWGGLLEQLLLWVMAAIVVSGLVGLAVQQFLPGQMTARIPRGTFYAQIPHECRLLQLEGDVAVADVSSPLEMPPDLEVATPERLKRLGVKEVKDAAKKGKHTEAEHSPADRERQKHQRLLASVYRLSETHNRNGEAASPETEAVTATTAEPAARQPPAGKLSAVMVDQTAPVAATGTEAPSPAKKAKPSAAEMLVAARAKKVAQQAAASETPEASPEPTSAVPKAAPARPEEQPTSNTDQPAPPKNAKPSAAEMLAAARAKKAAQQPAVSAGEPQTEADPAKSMPQAAVKHTVAPPTVERDAVSPAVREYCIKELREFYVQTVRPFLGDQSRTSGPLGNDVTASGLFAAKKTVWPDDVGAVVERLADLCETRRQLAVQERMHRWLHGWLFVHVPLSMCLLGLGLLHAVLALYY